MREARKAAERAEAGAGLWRILSQMCDSQERGSPGKPRGPAALTASLAAGLSRLWVAEVTFPVRKPGARG
jgi:hypothetical protein